MRPPGRLGALAIADFRERVRRPAYLVILAGAVGLGYLAVPAADAHWVIVDVGGHRGRYTSGYVGMVTAFAAALWLLLAGFYLVRGTITRDERDGPGELLAATPLSRLGYLTGKYVSNLLVLGSMTGVVAGTALVLQLVRGESRVVDPVALLLPYALITLPVLALAAAAAVLFDTVRPLRAGLGNIVWFFGWMVVALASQGSAAPFGGVGTAHVAASLRGDLPAGLAGAGGDWFSFGLVKVDQPLRTFEATGLRVGGDLVADRLLLTAVAIGLAVLPALWYRFDPARGHGRPGPSAPPAAGSPPAGHRQPAGVPTPPPMVVVPRLTPRPEVRPAALPGGVFGRLLAGELRVLARGASRWWWLGVAVLTAVGLLAPIDVVTGPLLLTAWIWPVLLWSRLGTRRHEDGVDSLLEAYPGGWRHLVAEWASGLLLTVAAGLVPALRMAATGDWSGLAAWTGGALLIPSLALALGALGRSHRLFQVVYLALWYVIASGAAALDVFGAVRRAGHPVGPPPVAVAALSVALLALAYAVTAARHARR